jgi:hypothetical protein
LGSTFPDSLHILYSAVGDTTPEATSWALISEFKVITTGDWEHHTLTLPTTSANGRIAIRYAVVDGGPDGINSNYVGIDQIDVFSPSPADGQILSMISPASDCGLSATETVSVLVTNIGTTVFTGYDISYSVNGGTPVTETSTTIVNPGDSITHTFATTADLSALGASTLDFNIIATGDNNNCNDSLSLSIFNTAPSVPLTTTYRMGFEITDDLSAWILDDADGDGNTWGVIDTLAHWGTTCAFKSASAGPDNDWLFTSCLEMVAGTSYTLDYWYAVFDLLTACELETYIGSSPDSASMTQLIVQDPIPVDLNYQHSISVFTVPASGIYYLGFHAHSTGTGTSALFLDDIGLGDGSTVSITDRPGSTGHVNIFPNPNTGIFYLNSKVVSKNNIVEVFDVKGMVVYKNTLNNLNNQRIDLSNYANGIYNIRIISDSNVENHSVVINR